MSMKAIKGRSAENKEILSIYSWIKSSVHAFVIANRHKHRSKQPFLNVGSVFTQACQSSDLMTSCFARSPPRRLLRGVIVLPVKDPYLSLAAFNCRWNAEVLPRKKRQIWHCCCFSFPNSKTLKALRIKLRLEQYVR